MAIEHSTVLRTKALSRVFGTGELAVKALQEVDLDLKEAELVVMLGASGSGKSTLLNILGGLDKPSSGDVWYQDLNLSHANDGLLTEYRRRHVGFVFQFYNLIASLTAAENVKVAAELVDHAMPAEEALALVGLEQRAHHFPSQLSGGEQQRVAIARAIAKRPSLLLCDEPTGALDSKTGIKVLQALAQVNREMKTATVIITHNASIANMADRVITLSDGRIASESTNVRRADPASLAW